MNDAAMVSTIKQQALELIATITASPRPSYQIDGQAVSWGEYLARLQETVAWCDRQLAQGEPFEIRSQGYTP